MSSQCETMAIIMTIRILVNWKSLGHLRGEASSPYSKHARLPLEWKQGKASPPHPPTPIAALSRQHTRMWTDNYSILVCLCHQLQWDSREFPPSVCGDKKLEGGARRKEVKYFHEVQVRGYHRVLSLCLVLLNLNRQTMFVRSGCFLS